MNNLFVWFLTYLIFNYIIEELDDAIETIKTNDFAEVSKNLNRYKSENNYLTIKVAIYKTQAW